MGGKRVLDLDDSYYFGLINLTIKNQPNSQGKAPNDQAVREVAGSSMWRCGDNGWIAFENYCQGGVIPSDDQGRPDHCIRPTGNVP